MTNTFRARAPATVPVALSFLVLGAHFLRSGGTGLLAACLLAPTLLLTRRRWALHAVQALLVAGSMEWARTAVELLQVRLAHGQEWARMVTILGAVAAVAAGSAAGLHRVRHRFGGEAVAVPTAVFLLTALCLGTVQAAVDHRMLLLDRFWPGGGWLEVLALSAYGAWVADKMRDPRDAPRWRKRVWALFSAVFFAQLLLGLLADPRFLQTGRLHLPVPALILGGPLFRGEGFFMPALFLATVALVGPAWCSHLCYVGAWDARAAEGRRLAKNLPGWRGKARYATTALVVAAALAMRLLGVPGTVAAILAAAFGLAGVGLMVTWSRRTGVMTHCTAFCPMGLVATRLGKLNPFRVAIAHGCDDCHACVTACRFDALSKADVARRRPGEACTLCGDCLHRCRGLRLEYRFGPLRGPAARALFLVLVVTLHATFLGLARL